MSGYLVRIPGIEVPYSARAENDAEALKDALFFHGLSFAPPGTTVTPIQLDHYRRSPQ